MSSCPGQPARRAGPRSGDPLPPAGLRPQQPGPGAGSIQRDATDARALLVALGIAQAHIIAFSYSGATGKLRVRSQQEREKRNHDPSKRGPARTYFEAADSGDLATLDELLADNISAHIAGTHALAGDYQGKEAVFGFFGRLAQRSGGTARLQPRDALVDDWFAVALVEAAGRVGDETLDGERALLVLRVQDGRFVELWSHHYDQPRMNRAWS